MNPLNGLILTISIRVRNHRVGAQYWVTQFLFIYLFCCCSFPMISVVFHLKNTLFHLLLFSGLDLVSVFLMHC